MRGSALSLSRNACPSTKSDFSRIFGARGDAHVYECPGATRPALAKLVSSATPGWRSITVTSRPSLARYQAAVTPAIPPPSTTVFMADPVPCKALSQDNVVDTFLYGVLYADTLYGRKVRRVLS